MPNVMMGYWSLLPGRIALSASVGYGLEEKVTDALAGDIIRSNMIPAFKQQKLAKGLELAINALNNQLTSQHQYPTNPSESESASSSDHYYFAIFWVFAVMFFPFWFFIKAVIFVAHVKVESVFQQSIF